MKITKKEIEAALKELGIRTPASPEAIIAHLAVELVQLRRRIDDGRDANMLSRARRFLGLGAGPQ